VEFTSQVFEPSLSIG